MGVPGGSRGVSQGEGGSTALLIARCHLTVSPTRAATVSGRTGWSRCSRSRMAGCPTMEDCMLAKADFVRLGRRAQRLTKSTTFNGRNRSNEIQVRSYLSSVLFTPNFNNGAGFADPQRPRLILCVVHRTLSYSTESADSSDTYIGRKNVLEIAQKL